MVVPRWIARLIYAFRGKRKVRLHLEGKLGIEAPSMEGILLGRWAGHYVLMMPKMLQGEDRSIALEGMIEIPIERVIFLQILGGKE